MKLSGRILSYLLAGISFAGMTWDVRAQDVVPHAVAPDLTKMPWMDPSLDPDRRADLVVAAMTQEEKIQLVHGSGNFGAPVPAASNGGAGFVPGIPRLGLPDVNMADSTVGVTRGAMRSRYSTWMPASMAEASTWDPKAAFDYGALIGRELRAQGYNASLAGGVNLMRDPRGGRTFEYRGEDPVLAGTMAASFMRGLQAQKVIGDIKHYAFNDQETGRHVGDVQIGEADGRESDLLAFEIGIRDSNPGMVMCSYNKVNGDWACENDYLMNKVLKGAWGFKGMVLSDWGGTHSTDKAIIAGLDQEQPGDSYFGDSLARAVASGKVPQKRLDEAVHRIVRTMFALGVVDTPIRTMVVDVDAGRATAQAIAEQGIVLLKNDGVLPLSHQAKSIVLIGGNADRGLLTGGGSGQVDPPGGNAVPADGGTRGDVGGFFARAPVWYPDPPLRAIRAATADGAVGFDDGADPASAAAAARGAAIAIVFVAAPASEGRDLAGLSLPGNQDALIAAVAAANPNTVVVLETGGPVSMPWLDKVKGVVQAWFPGARGSEALARLLFGDVNFTGKLPISFPRSEADLPNRIVAGTDIADVPMLDAAGKPVVFSGRPFMTKPPFKIVYPEGADVGYRWYERRKITPLFAFGHGLSYTHYAYSALTVAGDEARLTVTNAGGRTGTEIAQVYARVPGRQTKRLVGWARVDLAPGQSRSVGVRLEPLALSTFDEKGNKWVRPRGAYQFYAGGASDDTPLTVTVRR